MKERLVQIMEHYNYSPSHFADEIDVQRSMISHILSERNRPGVDMLQKILARFPEISARWLLLGEGDMLKSVTNVNLSLPEAAEDRPQAVNQVKSHEKPEEEQEELENEGETEAEPEKGRPAEVSVSKEQAASSKIKRITVYYTGGAYQDFLPED